MLGDYLVTMLFILAMLGFVCILLRNAIPGILSGFLAVLKGLFYLILLPISLIFGIFSFIFRRRDKFVGVVTRTKTFTRTMTDRKGNIRTSTESIQTKVPVKGRINKSGRF